MNTRSEIARYAQRTCIAALEQAAARRASGAVPEVIDHVGYVPTMLEEALRPFWGLTPLMRDACPTLRGRTFCSFSWASFRRPTMAL